MKPDLLENRQKKQMARLVRRSDYRIDKSNRRNGDEKLSLRQ